MDIATILEDTSGTFAFAAVDGSPDDADYASCIWAEQGLVCRKLQAKRMLDASAFFHEIGAAFQFPSDYPGGWDATSEYLRDLDWMRAQAGYVVIIPNAERLFERDLDQIPKMISTLGRANESWSWAQMTTPEDRWRDTARSFHTILFTENFELLQSNWPVPIELARPNFDATDS